MPQKRVFSLFAILLVLTGTILFIYYNNDHKECDVEVEQIIGKNGEHVTRTTHVCKERFSF